MSTIITSIENRPELYARFEVLKRLGDGAAASVYHVKTKDEGKEYALKVLTNDTAFDENTIERFREELRVTQKIRHPNIVEAYQFITLDGAPAYLMELVHGSDLGKLFRAQKFTEQQIVSILRQLLPALQELHKHKVLHRDIKLENILLREDGTIKLSDLGLMKQHSKELTATGVILGTAHYLPPEYVREGVYDVRSEIYVVGTMLFEMVTGHRWLSHLAGAQALEHLVKTNFAFPLDTIEGISPRLMYVLERCVAMNPGHRFQSAREVLKALDEGPSQKETLKNENGPTRVSSVSKSLTASPHVEVFPTGLPAIGSKNKVMFAVLLVVALILLTIVVIILYRLP